MENSVIPPWLNSLAAYLAFAFNQLNDPVEVIALLVLGFKYINKIFELPQHTSSLSIEELDEDEEKKDAPEDEKQVVRQQLVKTHYPLTRAQHASMFRIRTIQVANVTPEVLLDNPAP